jgi:hypothetical protein
MVLIVLPSRLIIAKNPMPLGCTAGPTWPTPAVGPAGAVGFLAKS